MVATRSGASPGSAPGGPVRGRRRRRRGPGMVLAPCRGGGRRDVKNRVRPHRADPACRNVGKRASCATPECRSGKSTDTINIRTVAMVAAGVPATARAMRRRWRHLVRISGDHPPDARDASPRRHHFHDHNHDHREGTEMSKKIVIRRSRLRPGLPDAADRAGPGGRGRRQPGLRGLGAQRRDRARRHHGAEAQGRHPATCR